MVEHAPEERGVDSSILSLGTMKQCKARFMAIQKIKSAGVV